MVRFRCRVMLSRKSWLGLELGLGFSTRVRVRIWFKFVVPHEQR